jgi:uncharacterized protein (DUF983 family)
MSSKKSTLYSILTMSCPRCRDGKMFPAGTLYTARFMHMNKTCPCCGQSFEPEPGFYFGAMFTSYAIYAAFFLIIWLALYFLAEEVTFTMLGIFFLLVVIGLLPVTFRLSRALWIHIFVRYEGPCKEIPKRRI